MIWFSQSFLLSFTLGCTVVPSTSPSISSYLILPTQNADRQLHHNHSQLKLFLLEKKLKPSVYSWTDTILHVDQHSLYCHSVPHTRKNLCTWETKSFLNNYIGPRVSLTKYYIGEAKIVNRGHWTEKYFEDKFCSDVRGPFISQFSCQYVNFPESRWNSIAKNLLRAEKPLLLRIRRVAVKIISRTYFLYSYG